MIVKSFREIEGLPSTECGAVYIGYAIKDEMLVVLIVDVGHRKEVYR